MKVIRNLNHINKSNLCLAIGNFDGVHLGHLAIIDEVKRNAKEKNLLSAVLTFEPHPTCFFNSSKKENFRITSLAQKLKIFQELQIDIVIVLTFNRKVAEIEAEDFIERILLKNFQTKHLVVGYDFIFGKNRLGNFSLLEELSKKLKFGLSKISAQEQNSEIYSSSLIRQLIANGNISKANHLLNKNFAISGLVSHGRKLASQLGFPTANLFPKSQIIKPKFGVYKSETFIPHLNKRFSSITNFGIKPTISSDSKELFETHILNFSENIYGKKIVIELVDFIRDEKKFSSISELQEQIKNDIKKINL